MTTNSVSISELFSSKLYIRLLPFISIMLTAIIMPAVVLPGFGAKWFAHCNTNAENESKHSCVFDYTAYNLFSSLFTSINGLTTFLFSSYIGHLSDIYGRKPFIYLFLVISLITNFVMIFYVNLWMYWSLQALNGIFSIGSILTAYISDIVTKQSLKAIAFSMLYAFGSISILVGSVLAVVIGSIGSSSEYIWITVSSLFLITLIYTNLCLKESNDRNSNTELQSISTNINPIKQLFYVNSNPIILWCSIINFIITIPMAFFGVLIVFIDEQLHINNEAESYLLNMVLFVSMAISSTITSALILPLIKKYNIASDLNIVVIGVIFVIIGNLIFSFIPYVTYIDQLLFGVNTTDNVLLSSYFIVIMLASFCFSFFVFIGSALNSIITQYINHREHGFAFGILQSFGSITTIIAPFGFGYGYNKSKQIGIPSLMLYIICLFLFASLVILIFPLKSTIKELDKHGQILSLNRNKIVNSDKTSILEASPNEDVNCNYLTFDSST